jgi:ClpA/ClpB-like protein
VSYHWKRAAAEARALGLNYVGADHLLLAILESDRTAATRALAESGVRYAAAHDLVQTWSLQTDPGPIRRRPVRTPRVRKVIRVATVLARLRGRRHAADVDILVALMYEEGPHEAILRSLGTRRVEVVEALRRDGVPVPVAPPVPERDVHAVSVLVPAEHGRALIDVLTAQLALDPDRYFPYGRARWGFNYTSDPAVWRFSADAEFGLPEVVERVQAHTNTA